MSIYAGSFFEIRVPVGHWSYPDNRKWVQVFGMSVPSHIGYPDEYPEGDPYGEFLPPPVTPEEYEEDVPRAIVVIEKGRHKKIGQRYEEPLFTVTGREWEKMTFGEVLARIQQAVNERYKDGSPNPN